MRLPRCLLCLCLDTTRRFAPSALCVAVRDTWNCVMCDSALGWALLGAGVRRLTAAPDGRESTTSGALHNEKPKENIYKTMKTILFGVSAVGRGPLPFQVGYVLQSHREALRSPGRSSRQGGDGDDVFVFSGYSSPAGSSAPSLQGRDTPARRSGPAMHFAPRRGPFLFFVRCVGLQFFPV